MFTSLFRRGNLPTPPTLATHLAETIISSCEIESADEMHYETSPSSSVASSPVSIPSSTSSHSSSTSTLREFLPSSSTLTHACAFPSWPSGNTISSFNSSAPSSFISDADLFFEEDLVDGEVALLSEAPAPPRVPVVTAMPLPPLYASNKPKKARRSSKVKPRRSPANSKPMTPIAEFPEIPE